MKSKPTTNPKGKLTARRLRRRVSDSDHYYYLVTIANNNKLFPVTEDPLESIVNLAEYYQEFHTINKCYEYGGKYGQLHCHLIVSTDYPLKYTDFNQIYNYRINYQQLLTREDVHRAQLYVTKDQYNDFQFANAI